MENSRPLEGVKIVDLTWVYAGPFSTLLLSDLGAEIVKLEAPPIGDYTRILPPFNNGWSGYFYMLNRGKKSITLNLKNEEGKKVFLALCKRFDVLTENFVPGTLEKLGLAYDTIHEANPRLVIASISGFGSYGPYSQLPCVDPVAQAMGGLMSMTGYPNMPPVKTGPAIADALAALFLAVGILSTLRRRDATGKGQRLEVSMMDSVFSVLEESVIRASITGDPLPARGNTDPLGAPWDAFPTKDGKWVMVCNLGTDRFETLYRHIGREDIVEKYKGDSVEAAEARSRDLAYINGAFAEWTKTQTAEDLLEFLYSLGIPCGEVKDVKELLEDSHLRERNMVIDVEHEKLGSVKTFNTPIKFFTAQAGVGGEEDLVDAELGEHTEEVLSSELGLSVEEISNLRKSGAIWA